MISIEYYDDNGDDISQSFPSMKEVCSECEGEGTVLCEGMRGHAYSIEEFEEAFCDEEDREAYFQRGGKYDVTCPTCKGLRVVDVVDRDACSGELKVILDTIQEQQEESAKQAAADRLTRRMESGQY